VEAPAIVHLGPHLTPEAVRHAEPGLSWTVLAVLEDWTTPRYSDDAGTPMETRRYKARVTGPLPGRPAGPGEFTMIIRRYGDRPGWWICPEPAGTGPG
jgi:hypothetical protein